MMLLFKPKTDIDRRVRRKLLMLFSTFIFVGLMSLNDSNNIVMAENSETLLTGNTNYAIHSQYYCRNASQSGYQVVPIDFCTELKKIKASHK